MRRDYLFLGALALAAIGVSNLGCTNVLGTFTEGAGGTSTTSASTGTGGGATGSAQASGSGGAGGSTASGSGDPCASCSPNAQCLAGTTCSCKPGFEGDGVNCSDVDECAASPSPCGANANCNNTAGSFQCTCAPGSTFDAKKDCIPIWKQVGAAQNVAFGGFGSFVAGTTTQLYIANNGAAGAFFFSFDLVKKGFVEEAPQPSSANDFCACGFTATWATSGNQVFSFGNFGLVYNGLAWNKVSAYGDPFMRGEAASASFEKTVFLLGGRDDADLTADLLAYNLSAGTFTVTTAPYIYGPVTSAGMASFKNLLFAAGGLTPKDNQTNHAAMLDVDTMKWQQLPDAPVKAERADVALFKENFVLSNGKELVAFSLADDAWSKGVFNFPLNLTAARLVSTPTGEAFAIGNMGSNLHVYALNVLPL